MEMLYEDTSPQVLNEYRVKIGKLLKDIPGVNEAKMTALLTGNPPTIRMKK